MTDADLLMLENLTYIDRGFNKTGCRIDMVSYDSLGDYFDDVFTEDVLAEFDMGCGVRDDENGNPTFYYFDELGGENSSQEWAAMIRYMKNNDEIRNMRVVDAPKNSNGKTYAMRFEPTPGHEGNTVVAFRGTLGGAEWIDNVKGMIQTDTEAQREALDYIESIPSDNITVVGHSKGGNKAQYVAILSDKVKRAVSFDGQGFSKAFIDKYSAEILKNAEDKIHCYGLDTDYVHGLLYYMPNVDQVYVTGGTDVTDVKQNHSPDAFFAYTQNEKGEWIIEVVNDKLGDEDDESIMYFEIGDESRVQMLHRFTNFVMNVASEENQQEIVGFVSELLAMKFGENPASDSEMKALILQKSDTVGLVLSYLVLYYEIEGYSYYEITRLIEELQVEFQIEIPIDTAASVVSYLVGDDTETNKSMKREIAKTGTELYILFKTKGKLRNRIRDSGKYGKVVKEILGSAQSGYKNGKKEYEAKYGKGHNEAAFEDPKPAIGRVWDFSEETYNKLMQINSEMRKLTIPGAEWWAEYAHYRWYSNIDAEGDRLWFKENANQLYERCVNCESKINTVFDREKEIYKTAIGKLESICEDLAEARGKLAEITGEIYNNV